MLDETPNMIGIPGEMEEHGRAGGGHVREILATMDVGTNKRAHFGGAQLTWDHARGHFRLSLYGHPSADGRGRSRHSVDPLVRHSQD